VAPSFKNFCLVGGASRCRVSAVPDLTIPRRKPGPCIRCLRLCPHCPRLVRQRGWSRARPRGVAWEPLVRDVLKLLRPWRRVELRTVVVPLGAGCRPPGWCFRHGGCVNNTARLPLIWGVQFPFCPGSLFVLSLMFPKLVFWGNYIYTTPWVGV
jgi:hypothetical protein